MLTIPKVKIDSFDGNSSDYQTFIALFEEAVGKKNTDDDYKLIELLQFTSGPAHSAIKNCALVGGSKGYKHVRSILKNRFGDDHLISQGIIDELKHGKSVAKGSDIRQLADELTMVVTALDGLGMFSEINNQQSILDIMKRCPSFINYKWRNKTLECKHEKCTYPSFRDFADFMDRMG